MIGPASHRRAGGVAIEMASATVLVSAILSILADQATKTLVLSRVRRGQAASFGPVTVRRALNARGGARLLGGRAGLVTFWVVELALFLVLVELAPPFRGAGVQVALGLALGGAAGNLADRLWRGGVVDFIDVGVWPVFNLADVAIVAGVLLAALSLL